MPLFFFISGYFVYTTNYNLQIFVKRSKNRLIRQLYPTIIFWIMYCILFKDFIFDVFDIFKNGYWFTLVSVEMFFLIAPIITFLSIKGVSRLNQNIIYIIYGFLLYIATLKTSQMHNHISDLFSFNRLVAFLPFFFMGILYKLNKDMLAPILLNKFVVFGTILIFYLCYDQPRPKLLFLASVSGIIFVHYFIYKIFNRESIAKTRVSTVLRYIGTMTLEIYLLHYYFLRLVVDPLFLHYEWFSRQIGTFVELPLYLLLSICNVGICLGTVYLMKQIRIYPLLFPSADKKQLTIV